jgi:hypothetical protein
MAFLPNMSPNHFPTSGIKQSLEAWKAMWSTSINTTTNKVDNNTLTIRRIHTNHYDSWLNCRFCLH